MFVSREVLPVGRDQPLGVHSPDPRLGFLFGQALEPEEANELGRYSHASGPGAEEEDAMLIEGETGCSAGEFGRIGPTRYHNPSSPSDGLLPRMIVERLKYTRRIYRDDLSRVRVSINFARNKS